MAAFLKLKWFVQVLIVAAVCGVGLGAAWYFVFAPKRIEIEAQEKDLADKQMKVADSLTKKARFEQFKKESEALEVRLNELKMVLPQEKETQQLLNQVQDSARRAGLEIRRGVSKPTVDHDVYTDWPIEMEVSGTYHNLGQFFERIHNLDRIVNIAKLRIDGRSADSENSRTPSISATYEATTFVYREDSPVPASASKKAAK